mgnify:CR=1 FL=1
MLTAGAGGDVANELAQLGGSVPTQPQRRVQQSISLAQRLLKVRRATWLRVVDWLNLTHSLAPQSQAEVESLKQQLRKLKKSLGVATRDAKVRAAVNGVDGGGTSCSSPRPLVQSAKQDANMARQPQHFLVGSASKALRAFPWVTHTCTRAPTTDRIGPRPRRSNQDAQAPERAPSASVEEGGECGQGRSRVAEDDSGRPIASPIGAPEAGITAGQRGASDVCQYLSPCQHVPTPAAIRRRDQGPSRQAGGGEAGAAAGAASRALTDAQPC